VSIEAINPATGEVLGSYPEHRDHEISTILDEAHEAWESWRATTFAHRGELMCRAAAALRERRRDLARLMALEMGKPVTQGDAEIEKCAWACEHFAERAEAYLATDVISTEAARSYVAFEPLGVVLAVMPWNFPFWQVFRFAAPALMAGNVGVLKHASNVPGCAVAIESIFEAAGFPRGAFRTLLIGSAEVRKVIEHRRVRAVTLTGSTPAGAAVAAVAGASIKKTVLELGGSDPYIVLDDAEVDRAAAICVAARIVNSGQSCIAAKRFIVAASRADVFVEHFVSGMKAKRVGDPLDDATEIGPLARRDLRDELHRQVEASVARGAKVVVGGQIPGGPGAYYPATVLTGVAPGMPAYDEELFGPVAAVIEAGDEDDAIRIANETSFGLGAAVFTRDLTRGERVARRLEAGAVFVNAQVASDPRLPFGGIKASGYGRELGAYGIKEFVNAKTVVVA
jgi:succinate-semialdehyde dehydrogenase/glutarate-semialdehyde dehydrogenase